MIFICLYNALIFFFSYVMKNYDRDSVWMLFKKLNVLKQNYVAINQILYCS